MRKFLFLLMLLLAIFQMNYGVISSTLTRTDAEVTAITTSVDNNAFLTDTNHVTAGQLYRNDLDLRDPDYQPYKDLKGMAGNLQKALFPLSSDDPQEYMGHIINGLNPTSPSGYHGLSNLNSANCPGRVCQSRQPTD